jgi:hypothetical protein
LVEAVGVLALTRCGVDTHPQQIRAGLEDVETLATFLDGSAANLAVAAARLGHPAALISGVGDVLRDLPTRRLPAVLRPPARGTEPLGPSGGLDVDPVDEARLFWAPVT